MSITQRYTHWYVGKFGLPHLGVSVVSTQIKYPVSSTRLTTAFISALQYANTGKGAFDYSHRQLRVSAYILIEKTVDLI